MSHQEHAHHPAQGQAVKDPVCGMDVKPESTAARYEHGGRTYYFCCTHCMEKFRAEPRKFLGQPAGLVMLEAPAATGTKQPAGKAGMYTCPMDPEVQQEGPGPCPKCGMALEPMLGAAPLTKTEYVCPMHSEVVSAEPGSCPVCGMALEARVATVEEEEEASPELVDMTRRFRVSLALSVPVLLLAMAEMIPGQPVGRLFSDSVATWIQFALSTPVVLWGGWPFFQRCWASFVYRSLNMFTLIAIGTGTA